MAKILLVDDDFSGGNGAASICAYEGHEIVTATHGLEALEALAEDNFDVILVTALREVAWAIHLLRIIRTDAVHVRVPVIAFVDHADYGGLSALTAAGVTSVVAVPFRSQAVRSALDEVLVPI